MLFRDFYLILFRTFVEYCLIYFVKWSEEVLYITRDSKYFLYLHILDMTAMILAYLLSAVLRFEGLSNMPDKYGVLLAVVLMSLIYSNVVTKSFNHYFERGYLKEYVATFKQTVSTLTCSLVVVYFMKTQVTYSRLFIIFLFIYSLFISFIFRVIFKNYVAEKYRNSRNGSKVMIVTTSDRLDEILQNARKDNCWDYSFQNICVIDKDMIGEKIGNKTIDGNLENMLEIARIGVLDEVLVHVGYHNPKLKEIIEAFRKMGVTVHVVLNNLSFNMANPRLETFSGFTVLTTSNNTITHAQLLAKRIMDICGSLVGLLLTGIISIFVVPAIKLESPGPVVYSQTRIGRNGRKFKIYKFRSMYKDADARKAALMEQNKMNGLMFKMDDDPRITKVGKFIRKTSIDELPQFWNVLKGDMSLVGTRPPTVDEFEQYELHHKNRLSFKPGITGMWQATGRSDITDFEEVVQLDTKYIENWSLLLDIKLIFLTVWGVVRKKGAE